MFSVWAGLESGMLNAQACLESGMLKVYACLENDGKFSAHACFECKVPCACVVGEFNPQCACVIGELTAQCTCNLKSGMLGAHAFLHVSVHVCLASGHVQSAWVLRKVKCSVHKHAWSSVEFSVHRCAGRVEY